MKDNHLPVFGIGPALCIPMGIVTAIGIFLSVKGYVPLVVGNGVAKIAMTVLGILVILEGIACWIGADMMGGIFDCVRNNKLKTNGSYAFVRNPCYAICFLGCSGAILISHNLLLMVLPLIFWAEMTIVLKRTEEKWLYELYGQEYLDYCKKVNRCIPWLPRKG